MCFLLLWNFDRDPKGKVVSGRDDTRVSRRVDGSRSIVRKRTQVQYSRTGGVDSVKTQEYGSGGEGVWSGDKISGARGHPNRPGPTSIVFSRSEF